jgi:type II secretory pathway predicted ATPase ExeA
MRPVLIVDEAQEVLTTVFNELRVLTSKDFDSRSLLCVVFAGGGRLQLRFAR